MERTDWAKIALLVLLIALALRIAFGVFFAVPLEFTEFTGEGEGGELQEMTITEIQFCFAAKTEATGEYSYYYIVKDDQGAEYYLKAPKHYYSEVLTDQYSSDQLLQHGMTVVLPDPSNYDASELQEFYDLILFDQDYLEQWPSVSAAYAPFAGKLALDIGYTATTEDHPACFWLNLVCALSFLWLLGLLLAEYFSVRKTRKKNDKEISV